MGERGRAASTRHGRTDDAATHRPHSTGSGGSRQSYQVINKATATHRHDGSGGRWREDEDDDRLRDTGGEEEIAPSWKRTETASRRPTRRRDEAEFAYPQHPFHGDDVLLQGKHARLYLDALPEPALLDTRGQVIKTNTPSRTDIDDGPPGDQAVEYCGDVVARHLEATGQWALRRAGSRDPLALAILEAAQAIRGEDGAARPWARRTTTIMEHLIDTLNRYEGTDFHKYPVQRRVTASVTACEWLYEQACSAHSDEATTLEQDLRLFAWAFEHAVVYIIAQRTRSNVTVKNSTRTAPHPSDSEDEDITGSRSAHSVAGHRLGAKATTGVYGTTRAASTARSLTPAGGAGMEDSDDDAAATGPKPETKMKGVPQKRLATIETVIRKRIGHNDPSSCLMLIHATATRGGDYAKAIDFSSLHFGARPTEKTLERLAENVGQVAPMRIADILDDVEDARYREALASALFLAEPDIKDYAAYDPVMDPTSPGTQLTTHYQQYIDLMERNGYIPAGQGTLARQQIKLLNMISRETVSTMDASEKEVAVFETAKYGLGLAGTTIQTQSTLLRAYLRHERGLISDPPAPAYYTQYPPATDVRREQKAIMARGAEIGSRREGPGKIRPNPPTTTGGGSAAPAPTTAPTHTGSEPEDALHKRRLFGTIATLLGLPAPAQAMTDPKVCMGALLGTCTRSRCTRSHQITLGHLAADTRTALTAATDGTLAKLPEEVRKRVKSIREIIKRKAPPYTLISESA